MTVFDAIRSTALPSPPSVRRDRSWERTYVGAIMLADALSAIVAGFVAFSLRFGTQADTPNDMRYLWISLLLPLPWFLAVSAARAYEPRFLGQGSEEFRRVITAALWLFAIVGTFSWASKAEVARGYIIVAIPLTCVLTMLARYAARKRLHALRSEGACMNLTVVVGHPGPIAELVRQARREPYHGLTIIGACVPDGFHQPELDDLGLPVLGSFDDAAEVVRNTAADAVAVLSCPEMDGPALRSLGWELEGTSTDLIVAPSLMDVAGPRIAIRPVCGLPLLHVEEPELKGSRRAAKAVIDRAAAAIALLVLLPVFLVVAIAIKLDSGGSVFFRQQRVGRGGELFSMVKFRTMQTDAETRLEELAHLNESSDGLLFKIRHDPRVTRVGGFLRRYSLDELPQLFNVLVGHMSLVGPRPPLPSEAEQYGDDVRRRLLVKPGLTGLWQISGRADLSWEESVRLDLRYVENWSFALDLLILWKTSFVVFRGSGAY